MRSQNFETNSFCVGIRHNSPTKSFEVDTTFKGAKLLYRKRVEGNRKKQWL